jgi:sugar lactone lactonase YvrE
MKRRAHPLRLLLVPVSLLLATLAEAQTIPFTPEHWDLTNARVVEHLDRQALAGTALLRDAVFENGVIEVDVTMRGGTRSYPGVLFRVRSDADHERIYLRPHRAPFYADAVQYVAAFNGVDSWQLYNGQGYTAQALIPTDRWVHLKLEVSGTRARLFIDSASAPALVVWELQHGQRSGGIGLNSGPADAAATAFFSNFSWRRDDALSFGPPPEVYEPPGFLREWDASRPVARRLIDFDRYPSAEALGMTPWTRAAATRRGLLDVSRIHGRSGNEPEVVLLRTTVRAARDEVRKFWLGYSDEVSVFVNGQQVFYGNSAYRSRDPSFLGVLGLFDALALPLHRGDNELLFVLGESSGGWGLAVRDATAVLEAPGVRRLWASQPVLRIPESAAFDPARNAIYVSNYDGYNPSGGAGRQYLSRYTADARLEALQWVTGLNNPTGLAVRGDRLYAVEGRSLVEIDIPGARIVRRHVAQGAGFLNDVAVADNGDVYVSDSRGGAIYRLADGRFEEWLRSPEMAAPNGVHVRGDRLIVAVNGDRTVKAVDLATKAISTIATLQLGLLDGVDSDEAGNYLVSYNEGRLVRVTPAGEVTTLLDLTALGANIADFDYVPERGLLIVPTFLDNRVMVYRLAEHAGSGR